MIREGGVEWLVIDGKASKLVLPVRSRNPSRLEKRLRPAQLISPVNGLVWFVCEGVTCSYCVWPLWEYRVEIVRGRAYDRLSGLRHSVVREMRGLVGGMLVWQARWIGDLLVVDKLECPARVHSNGTVMCLHGTTCRGPGCLRECINRLTATRDP